MGKQYIVYDNDDDDDDDDDSRMWLRVIRLFGRRTLSSDDGGVGLQGTAGVVCMRPGGYSAKILRSLLSFVQHFHYITLLMRLLYCHVKYARGKRKEMERSCHCVSRRWRIDFYPVPLTWSPPRRWPDCGRVQQVANTTPKQKTSQCHLQLTTPMVKYHSSRQLGPTSLSPAKSSTLTKAAPISSSASSKPAQNFPRR